MFDKVLVANRGEIACRIIRTLERLGVASVAVYSEADTSALHVRRASEAVCIGPPPAIESYLSTAHILDAARRTGAQAIHPGYGFLSENAEFAEACAGEGIVFIGPTPAQMRRFGLKHEARALAEAYGVPLLPGSGLLTDPQAAVRAVAGLGYPVMLKSTAGGGGIGMQVCRGEEELALAFESVRRLGQNFFKQSGMFVEKYVEQARHVEVQIFGDGRGGVIALGERDCSLQRRNQKVVEETPAPGLDAQTREALQSAAVRLGQAVDYQSAGTVEFIWDAGTKQFYFLEVNTRLQVEHGVTEAVCGIDLVEWMIRLAAGEVPQAYTHAPRGHAIEVRLYAEDPFKNFRPGAGLLSEVRFPEHVRCDGWIERGTEVTPFYDPLLAKLIVHAESREAAVDRLARALDDSEVAGIETNLDYLKQVVADSAFRAGRVSTRLLTDFVYVPRTIDVLASGTHSTVQDYPGRIGYWNVGVPPSGPMDALAFRLANRILDNPPEAAGLELTLTGPELRFNAPTVICLTGARMKARLGDLPVSYGVPVPVWAGSVLRLGSIEGGGQRTYLAIRHGLDVPDYLGSKSTFTLGRFGGHAGRTLRTGDVLRLVQPSSEEVVPEPAVILPDYGSEWNLGVLYGPHGAPDFFTDEDISMFFTTGWKVHHNSARTGVRLIGPKPRWAREDGGEAGLHPSNIHDNAYAVGTVDFTGDMPVILGPDGPSLGGFVCPVTVVQAELWKVGQLKPGDTVRFHRLALAEALILERWQERRIAALAWTPPLSSAGLSPVSSFSTDLGAFPDEAEPSSLPSFSADFGADSLDEVELWMAEEDATPQSREALDGAVLGQISATDLQVAVTYRLCGDKYLLIEYGPMVLDLNLHFRVHALRGWLEEHPLPGVLELTPGVRSLQVHYDSRVLALEVLLTTLATAEAELPPIHAIEVRSRIVHLPLAWEDPSTLLAIEKYMQVVNPNAPWCPSNIEFIRRINGLDSIEQVREIVFAASYLVLGLGDVYLGAPVATPLDPRHRLVTTKYNPARTWTPENAVGIGGAYMCIYGMEGPGGYQFVGRTLQVWNRFRETADFQPGRPWLLRFFDQIRFYPVTGAELLRLREAFLHGQFQLQIEEETFNLSQYNAFLNSIAGEAAEFKARQQAAFEAERDRWAVTKALDLPDPVDEPDAEAVPPGSRGEAAPVPASVWQIQVQVGDGVKEGDPLVVLESMKMEITVAASVGGVVVAILCVRGQTVTAGQNLVAIRPDEGS